MMRPEGVKIRLVVGPEIILFLFLVSLGQDLSAQSDNQGWKLVKEKEGIRMFTRDSDQTRIKEFSAATVVDSDLTSLVAVFLDIPAMGQWVKDCKSAELLREESNSKIVYYMEVKAPFPFDNRDLIQELQISQDSVTREVVLHLRNRPNLIPEKKNIVRMPVADGFWRFLPVGNGKVQVRFQYQNDPGGGIPAWLVNAFIVDSPLATISNLKEQVQKPQYQRAQLSWIVN